MTLAENEAGRYYGMQMPMQHEVWTAEATVQPAADTQMPLRGCCQQPDGLKLLHQGSWVQAQWLTSCHRGARTLPQR